MATRGGRPQLGLKARHDTRAIGPKEVAQHLSRFWMSIFRELLLTPNSYRPESGGFGNIMKLSFQPYKVLLKWTPYVAVALFLVQTVSEIREGNKVQVVDESDFVYACLLYTSPSPRDGLLSRMPSSA